MDEWALSRLADIKEYIGHTRTLLGNHLRHAYRRLNARTLWAIYTDDLNTLEASIDAMIATYGPLPDRPPDD